MVISFCVLAREGQVNSWGKNLEDPGRFHVSAREGQVNSWGKNLEDIYPGRFLVGRQL